MGVHDFVGKTFKLKEIKGIVEGELDIEKENKGTFPEHGLYLFDIVSGSFGQFQQEKIAEFFEFDLEEDGIADEDPFIEEVSDYITDVMGLEGYFGFNYLEGDGSYGLFYYDY